MSLTNFRGRGIAIFSLLYKITAFSENHVNALPRASLVLPYMHLTHWTSPLISLPAVAWKHLKLKGWQNLMIDGCDHPLASSSARIKSDMMWRSYIHIILYLKLMASIQGQLGYILCLSTGSKLCYKILILITTAVTYFNWAKKSGSPVYCHLG